MVDAGDIYANLKTLLNKVYALKNHIHGNISNDGKITKQNSANTIDKIVTTKSDGEMLVSSQIPKSKISDFPTSMTPISHTDTDGSYGKATIDRWGHTKLNNNVSTDETTAATPKAVKSAYDLANSKPNLGETATTAAKGNHTHEYSEIINAPTFGTGLSTNNFDNAYKNKLNALSTYQIRLTDEHILGLRPNDDPHTLTVVKSLPKHAIYCLVTKNKTEPITEGQIIFIVNGKTYPRDIDEDGFAELDINLNAEEVNILEYINTGNIVTNPIVYTVIAVYRPGDEWTEAIDIKQMIVYD